MCIRDRLYPKLVEEPLDVRVVAVVMNNESGIDADLTRLRVLDHDGVRVATEAIPSFEQRYFMMRAEHVGTCQSRDA